jgi:hypothetical protein
MSKIIIGRFGPSARQIVDAAVAATDKPTPEIVVQSMPEGSTVLGGAEWSGARKKDYERGLSYLHDLCGRRDLKNQVFLGGACGATTWRQDIAIPMLEEAGCAYFNPQIDDWSEQDAYWKAQGVPGGIMEVEAKEKTTSSILLFPFDPTTRGIASLSEAIEFVREGKQKVVLVLTYVKEGTVIDGQPLTHKEAMDINTARSELSGFAKALGTPVFNDIKIAITYTVRALLEAEEPHTVMEV